MLTNQILSYYNHLLAASIMYLTMVDPLRDIANSLSGHMDRDHDRLSNLVMADTNREQHDHYKTLGVSKDATKQEIHKAFRQLARKYHPDKNKDKSATEEFIKIFKAYETLSDEKKRKEYDQQEASAQSAHSWSSSTTSNLHDFDINDFFRQYEDQFMRHAQHHQQSHQHHDNHFNQHYAQHQQDHFNFHGINLDDLFQDIGDDEFSSFNKWFDSSTHQHNHFHQAEGGHFGDGASYFGQHFAAPSHDSLNQYHPMHHHHYEHQSAHAYTCETITKRVNGMTMTTTNCS